MKSRKPTGSFAPPEIQRFILPITLSFIALWLSLDTEQTISLLGITIQETLEADTYFVGLLRDSEIHLDLFNDEGQYFNGATYPSA
jgi:hypothetical protein